MGQFNQCGYFSCVKTHHAHQGSSRSSVYTYLTQTACFSKKQLQCLIRSINYHSVFSSRQYINTDIMQIFLIRCITTCPSNSIIPIKFWNRVVPQLLSEYFLAAQFLFYSFIVLYLFTPSIQFFFLRFQFSTGKETEICFQWVSITIISLFCLPFRFHSHVVSPPL